MRWQFDQNRPTCGSEQLISVCLAAGLRRGHLDELDYTGIAQHWGIAYEQGALSDIDPVGQVLSLTPGKDASGHILVPARQIEYQVLVLALGGVTPDLGVEGVPEHAIRLDRANDAEALSDRLSAGLLSRSLGGDNRAFKVVIVGSGATGVELSAHLATDHLCGALAPRSELPTIDVAILEAADTFMPGIAEGVRQGVADRLAKVGVAMRTGQQVSKVSADTVETAQGQSFAADITVWATGRAGPPVGQDITALATNEKRQWLVRPTLQTTTSDAIFALGDCSYLKQEPAPPTAEAASEQAEHLARELPRYLNGEQPARFEFEDKGTLLSLGQAGSIGQIKGPWFEDIKVRGRLSRAAYKGLQRQHQFILLGPAKGALELISDVFGRGIGPRLKVH